MSSPAWWTDTTAAAKRVWKNLYNEDDNGKFGKSGWQPANAYSSLVLVVAGATIWVLGSVYPTTLSPTQVGLLGSLLVLVGLASFVFHATAKGWWGNYDSLLVVWIFLFFLAQNVSMLTTVDFWYVWLSLALVTSFAVHTKFLTNWPVVALGLVVLFTFVGEMVEQRQLDNWAFWTALVVVVVASGLWGLGRWKKFEVHYVWHCLMAVAAVLGWAFYRNPPTNSTT